MQVEITAEDLQRLIEGIDGMPIYADPSEPQVEDPSGALGDLDWQPACGTTNKLTRCLEGIRDVDATIASLSAVVNAFADRRQIKQLVTPIFNLAIGIRDLFNDIQSNRWKKLDSRKQRELVKEFRDFGCAVPTTKGPLKMARDKIAAHLDKDTSTREYRVFWDGLQLDALMRWIRCCIRMIDKLLGPDIYCWTRPSPYSNVMILMNVDGHEVSILVENNRPVKMLRFQMCPSPKWGIVREVRELYSKCFALAENAGINQGKIWRLLEDRQAAGSSTPPPLSQPLEPQ